MRRIILDSSKMVDILIDRYWVLKRENKIKVCIPKEIIMGFIEHHKSVEILTKSGSVEIQVYDACVSQKIIESLMEDVIFSGISNDEDRVEVAPTVVV